MAAERTENEDKIIEDYLAGLPIILDLGMEGGIYGEEVESWEGFVRGNKEAKFPDRTSHGESALVWGNLDHEHERYLEFRAFAIDKERRRPNFSARILEPWMDEVDYPASVRTYSYEDEAVFLNAAAASRSIPLTVVKQNIEIIGCAPKSTELSGRIGFHRNRVIYLENYVSDQLDTFWVGGYKVRRPAPVRFKPFVALSQSTFAPAPQAYQSRQEVGEDEELWVEHRRLVANGSKGVVFEFNSDTSLLMTPDSESYFSAGGAPVAPIFPEEVRLPKQLKI